MRIPVLQYGMAWGTRLTVARHRVGVAAVALDESGRVLLLRHVFHPLTPWGLPGGWLEQAEAPAAGVLRELKEETGLTAVVIAPLLITRERRPDHIGMAFLVQPEVGQIQLSAEILEARWFETHALPEALLPFVRQAITTAVAHKKRGAGDMYGARIRQAKG